MEFDAAYVSWKHWSSLFEADRAHRLYFERAFRDVALRGCKVFEVGFGAGRFMAWAREQGAVVAGCELIPELVRAGRERGYDTRCGTVQQVIEPGSESFDVIAAFDVLEHVQPASLAPMLRFIAGALVPGGRVLVRVPNGESPFGRVWQHGDLTHVNTLSKGKFAQIAQGVGLELAYCDNDFRVRLTWGRDRLIHLVRDAVEVALGCLYFEGRRPMDPNIVAILRRPDPHHTAARGQDA